MPATRPQRIVKRAVMALAVVLLLLNGYVVSYVGMFWLAGRGSWSLGTVGRLQTTVFEPIRSYSQHEYPGTDLLTDMSGWAHLRGSGNPMTWREYRDAQNQSRENHSR
ncbi:MAG: hypothetical protein U0992_15615 [Planctomycetaceae bacterium]